ncbi:MAG: efflux RND transporter periplasmic adaptor subunit [Cytophagales bacterium]|nr:efflux RND transporter periplasmic adaptor subunit [Cytophagales bacterium]
MKTLKIYAFILLLVATGACNNEKSAEVDSEHHDDEQTDIIELTQEQIDAVGIEIDTIEEKNLSAIVKASGMLEVPPQNRADISVLMGGSVKQIFVLEGSYVKKGQVLLTIANLEFIKMQQEYLADLSNFSYTEKEFQRQKELNEKNAGTGKVFQQTEASYHAEKAKLQSLSKQLQQLNVNLNQLSGGEIIPDFSVVAPISGVVAHISVNLGTFVEPGKVIMDIVDNSQIHCDLQVYEKDLFKVKVGQKVNFMLTNQNNQQIQGEIYGVNQSFEGESKAVLAHAVVKNVKGLKLFPGMYVSASIDIGAQKVKAVPVDAIVKSEGKNYIFILLEEKQAEGKEEEVGKEEGGVYFKKTEVVTGVSDLGFIEIRPLEELQGTTRVVIKGAFYILSKSQGATEEH